MKTGQLQYEILEFSHWSSVGLVKFLSSTSLAITPDGQTLVSGSWDKTIKIRDLKTGRLSRTLSEHLDRVSDIAISPDGKTLISGSQDKTIRLWDLRTGQLRRILSEAHVHAIAISPDRPTLFSGSWDRAETSIKLWDWERGKLLRTLTGFDTGISALALSSDGRTLAAKGRTSNEIKVFDLKSQKLQRNLSTSSVVSSAESIAFSPNGRLLAVGEEESILLWDVRTGQLVCALEERTELPKQILPVIDAVAFSPDGQVVVGGSGDYTLKVWHIPSLCQR